MFVREIGRLPNRRPADDDHPYRWAPELEPGAPREFPSLHSARRSPS